MCTVALIHDVTSKNNVNIEGFSKTPSVLCFQPTSIPKAPTPAAAGSPPLSFPAAGSHVSDTKPGRVPGWVPTTCCAVVVKSLEVLSQV